MEIQIILQDISFGVTTKSNYGGSSVAGGVSSGDGP
jgi:hypothetical protein